MSFVSATQQSSALIITIARNLLEYVSNGTVHYNCSMGSCTAHFTFDRFPGICLCGVMYYLNQITKKL